MKQLNINAVEEMAQNRGLKMTPQRRAIIDYLQAAENHPTTDEVLKAVNERFPMTSRATVYNTINWLKEAGMLQEVFEGGCVRLDPNFDQYHHFVCRKSLVIRADLRRIFNRKRRGRFGSGRTREHGIEFSGTAGRGRSCRNFTQENAKALVK